MCPKIYIGDCKKLLTKVRCHFNELGKKLRHTETIKFTLAMLLVTDVGTKGAKSVRTVPLY